MDLAEFHNVLKANLGNVDSLRALKDTVEMFLLASKKPMNRARIEKYEKMLTAAKDALWCAEIGTEYDIERFKVRSR